MLDKMFADGQPKTRALIKLGQMLFCLIKFIENTGDILVINTDARILNRKPQSYGFLEFFQNRNSGADISYISKFAGIVDQIDQNLFQPQAVNMKAKL